MAREDWRDRGRADVAGDLRRAGGQALGLEQAGFVHEAVVELDPNACETLRLNRGAAWKIIEGDIHDQDGRGFSGIDLLAGGIPCPPFSIAGKQLGG